MDWGELVTTLFGASGAVWVGWRAVADFLRTREVRQVQANLNRIARIYQTLQTAMAATRASRICVLKTENGGGIPRPGCAVKSSVLYENAAPGGARTLQTTWQNVLLTGTWVVILRDIVDKGSASLNKTLQLSAEQDFLLESDCDKVEFIRVAVTGPAMYYLSVHLADAVELTRKEEVHLKVCARVIQTLFESSANLTKGDLNLENL